MILSYVDINFVYTLPRKDEKYKNVTIFNRFAKLNHQYAIAAILPPPYRATVSKHQFNSSRTKRSSSKSSPWIPGTPFPNLKYLHLIN